MPSACHVRNVGGLAVFKGFVSMEEAIHFMLAGIEYSTCQKIPVYDFDSVKTVSAFGHRCSGNFASVLSTSLSDCDVENDDVEIVSKSAKTMGRQSCQTKSDDCNEEICVDDQDTVEVLNETTIDQTQNSYAART